MIKNKIVGYRYGKASGNSYNTRDNKCENGVSMVSVAGLPECRSFATMSAKENRGKYYYTGICSGKGGDDEYLLQNVKEISQKEYLNWLENNKEIISMFVKAEIEELEWAMNYQIDNLPWPMDHKIKEIKDRCAKQILRLTRGIE